MGVIVMSEAATKPVPAVFAAMQAVQREMLAGVGKNSTNLQQKYKYRSIEDVVNAMAPVLVANDLMIVPHCREATSGEYTTGGGTKMQRVFMHMDYKILCTKDGSEYTASVANEGSDMTDKASNKCLSFCYKYMLSQAFCIPFKDMGDDDGDNGRGYTDNATETRQGAAKGTQTPTAGNNSAMASKAAEPSKANQNNPEPIQQEKPVAVVRSEEARKAEAYAKALALNGLDHTKVDPGKFYTEWKDVVDSPDIGQKVEKLNAKPKALTLDQVKGIMWQVLKWNWYLCNIASAAGAEDDLIIVERMLDTESVLNGDAIKKMKELVKAAHANYTPKE